MQIKIVLGAINDERATTIANARCIKVKQVYEPLGVGGAFFGAPNMLGLVVCR